MPDIQPQRDPAKRGQPLVISEDAFALTEAIKELARAINRLASKIK